VLRLGHVHGGHPTAAAGVSRRDALVEEPGEPAGDILELTPGGDSGVPQRVPGDGHDDLLWQLVLDFVGHPATALPAGGPVSAFSPGHVATRVPADALENLP